MDYSFLDIRKQNPNLKDKYGHSIHTEYYQGVEAAYTYAYSVLSGERVAGKSEISACARFASDLKRGDLDFRPEFVEFAIDIANALRHPKGPLGGKPFYLMRWMIFIFANIFGFYYSDKARETLVGSRRFLTSSIWVARGNSKTVLGAVACLVTLLLTKNVAPVATCSAPKQKQSRLCFKDICKMIDYSHQSMKKRFRVLANEIRVKGGGSIIATSSQAKSLDGLRISFSLVDEVHVHPNSEILEVLKSGTQSSHDPHIMMISTAGTSTIGFGRDQFEYAIDVATGKAENDRMFALPYHVDESDNWEDESCWVKSNPALGHAVQLEGLRSAAVEAKRSPSDMANFKTKHLNLFVDYSEAGYIDLNELIECQHEITLDDYRGKKCWLGLDLASKSDLSSLTYNFWDDDTKEMTTFQKSYLPKSIVPKLTDRQSSRYHLAVKEGSLIYTDSDVTDFDVIAQEIVQAHSLFDVQALGIDAAAGGERFAIELNENHGIEAISVKQGFALSDTSIRLQQLIATRKFRYNGDRLIDFCMSNAQVKEGAYGDIKVIRDYLRPEKKIDILVSMIIGQSLIPIIDSEFIGISFIDLK